MRLQTAACLALWLMGPTAALGAADSVQPDKRTDSKHDTDRDPVTIQRDWFDKDRYHLRDSDGKYRGVVQPDWFAPDRYRIDKR